jgi:peptide/nickel transport system ATP-binding protein
VKVDSRDKDFFKQVQMIYQNPGESISHRMTVREAVREPLDIQDIGDTGERELRMMRALAEVQLPATEEFADTYPHHLSGGETQRVAIARALVLEPRLIIADEPTAFLDPGVQAKILKLLLDLQERHGLSMLFITHDIAVARKVSDRVAVMSQGRIVEEGPAVRVLSSPSHPYTRSLLTAVGGLQSDNQPV